MGRLDGKAALVTGAGSGIGRAMALACAAERAAVACADVRADAAEETARLVGEQRGKAVALHLDVTREDEVQRALRECIERLGRLDAIMNNAGIGGQPWDAVIAVNLTGVYHVLLHGAALLRERGGGAIVNTASIAGIRGIALRGAPDAPPVDPSTAAYTAAKHGVVGLTRQFALGYAPYGVRVNAVAPGYTETPMTARALGDPERRRRAAAQHPLGRVGQPEEIAAAAVFLASDDAAFVTGAVLPVDGGYTAR